MGVFFVLFFYTKNKKTKKQNNVPRHKAAQVWRRRGCVFCFIFLYQKQKKQKNKTMFPGTRQHKCGGGGGVFLVLFFYTKNKKNKKTKQCSQAQGSTSVEEEGVCF